VCEYKEEKQNWIFSGLGKKGAKVLVDMEKEIVIFDAFVVALAFLWDGGVECGREGFHEIVFITFLVVVFSFLFPCALLSELYFHWCVMGWGRLGGRRDGNGVVDRW
jgi:hypothetical protein